MARVRRGDIWLTDFDPAVGAEIRKTRPAVILQNDVGNTYSPLTIVAPITTTHLDDPYPFEVLIESTPKASKAILNQLRSIDKRRLIKRIGMVSTEEQARIDEALKVSLGMD